MYKVPYCIRLGNDIESLLHIVNQGFFVSAGREYVIVPADPGFDLGKGFFDRVEIRGVRRQMDESNTG